MTGTLTRPGRRNARASQDARERRARSERTDGPPRRRRPLGLRAGLPASLAADLAALPRYAEERSRREGRGATGDGKDSRPSFGLRPQTSRPPLGAGHIGLGMQNDSPKAQPS